MRARKRDAAALKESRQNQVNSSKYQKPSQLNIGDTVLLQNYNKTSKFDPTFQPEPCKIVDTDQRGHFLVIEREADGCIFCRDPDDVKHFTGHFMPNIATDHPLHNRKKQLVSGIVSLTIFLPIQRILKIRSSLARDSLRMNLNFVRF